jgi:hypothetical protein
VVGDAIGFIVDAIGRSVRAFTFLRSVAMVAFGGMLNAAEHAFGWIPGLGAKLRAAEDKFATFANKTRYNIDNIPDELALNVSTPGSVAAQRQLNAVTAAGKRIPEARVVRIATPGSVNAKLELSALKIGLDRLSDKTIGMRTRGVPVTLADLNTVKRRAESLERTYMLRIGANGSGAMATINAAKRAAEALDGRIITMRVRALDQRDTARFNNLPQQRATGGPVRKGQPYIVGEKRPELFIPEANGRIMPRVPASGGGGSFGGGGIAQLEVSVAPSGNRLIDEFMTQLRFRVATRHGGNVQKALGQ